MFNPSLYGIASLPFLFFLGLPLCVVLGQLAGAVQFVMLEADHEFIHHPKYGYREPCNAFLEQTVQKIFLQEPCRRPQQQISQLKRLAARISALRLRSVYLLNRVTWSLMLRKP